MVAIQRLHDLSQTFMGVIFFVPHILVVFDLALIIKRQSHKRVDRLCELRYLWSIRLLELEDDVIGFRFDNLCFLGLRFGEDLGYTYGRSVSQAQRDWPAA